MNIALILQMAAEGAPDRIGLVCDGVRWSYAELWRAARGTAQKIAESDCAYLGLLDESSAATPIALFGAALAGVPYVPLNYRLADSDLSALLDRIAPAFMVGDTDRIQRLSPEGKHVCLDRKNFELRARDFGGEAADTDYGGDGIAAQIFTSGTTAAPKAALLRHSNLLGYILGTVEFMSANEDDAQLVCVPPYHIAGISALMSSIYATRRIVLLPSFDPDDWLRLIANEGVTNAFVVPTMLQRIIARLEAGTASNLGSLRAIAYGGGRMPPELIARALELLPTTDFTNAYGLTETSSTVALLSPEDHRAAVNSADSSVRARLGSVGKPLPTIELEIRDENGRVTAPGEPGEIYVRGEQVSGEYRERSALDADGWFPTRDAGWLDEEGYLFLGGRTDDVIVRGGENISPGEIEDALAAHPAIAEAAAVGVPSTEWGETIGVAIVVRPGHDRPDDMALKQLIRERLRSSRVPEKIVFLEEMPYNEMGKLLRRNIKTLFSPT